MSYIKITIPNKGNIYLVHKEGKDEFIGDQSAIDYLYQLFAKAEKEQLVFDVSGLVDDAYRKKRFTLEDALNCDAIRAVLEHNNISVPDDLPTDEMRFIQTSKLDGIGVIV